MRDKFDNYEKPQTFFFVPMAIGAVLGFFAGCWASNKIVDKAGKTAVAHALDDLNYSSNNGAFGRIFQRSSIVAICAIIGTMLFNLGYGYFANSSTKK